MSETLNQIQRIHRVLKYSCVIIFLLATLLNAGIPCFGSGVEPLKEKTIENTGHAWITWERRGNQIYVKAWFKSNKERKLLFYKLLALKKGDSGQSATSQSGEFSAKAGEKVILSTLVLSMFPGDSCILTLKVFGAQHKPLSSDEKIIELPI